MKAVYHQANVNTLDDVDLIKYIGGIWESIKRVDEAMEADPKIIRMIEELDEYKAQHYLEEKKAYRANLKAARLIAKTRGLKIDVPSINNKGDDE